MQLITDACPASFQNSPFLNCAKVNVRGAVKQDFTVDITEVFKQGNALSHIASRNLCVTMISGHIVNGTTCGLEC